MPEYSSTTITPADGVQVPSMNGSTSGNFLLSALKSYILAEKGQANGLASLGSDGKLPAAQLPDLADDVIVVASYAVLPAAGTAGKIYITADNNKLYRWDPDLETPDYVELSVDLSAYATKAELAAEESARETEDSRLKSAIQGNTARIENLEQEHGGYVTVNYRGHNAVPTGKAKYALVESIVGKSRAWNQQCPAYNGTYSNNGIAIVGDGTGKVTVTVNNPTGFAQVTLGTIDAISNHRYAILGSTTAFSELYISGTQSSTGNYVIAPTLVGTRNILLYIDSTAPNGTYTFYPIIRDLTLILNDWADADITTANIPLMVKQIPDLLKPDAYGTSIVDTTYEGVKSKKDFFDQQMELGKYNNTTGAKEADSNRLRSVNRQPCTPNTTYYFNSPTNAYGYGYDANGNYLGSFFNLTANSNFTTPNNCHSFAFYVTTQYGTTYGNDIHVIGELDSLTLPSSVTLRSAGSVAEVYDLETGEKTNPLGEKSSGYNWTLSENGYWRSDVISDIKYNDGNTPANILCDKFVTYSSATLVNTSGLIGIAQASTGRILARTGDLVNAPSISIYYELATLDDPTQLTPVIDNTIQTEGGGTINTIQTQTTKIDNCLDVGYLAL